MPEDQVVKMVSIPESILRNMIKGIVSLKASIGGIDLPERCGICGAAPGDAMEPLRDVEHLDTCPMEELYQYFDGGDFTEEWDKLWEALFDG